MPSKKMTEALNEQLRAELYSSNLYLAMSAHFETQQLPGFAKWLRLQAQEEYAHAMKFFAYLAEVGAPIIIPALAAPPAKYSSAKEVFEKVAEHEKKVTAGIHGLVTLARAETDYATEIFLQWFVKEQVEEEAAAGLALHKLELAGTSAGNVMYLDKEFGKRGEK